MRILGIESSSLTASVAIVTDELLTAEYTINFKKTHSQTLLPMLDQIVNMTEVELSTIDAIAVSSGPGSFTGLRIGSATGKGLGLAMKKPLISVPTLEAMAYNLYGSEWLVCPIMDARRNQVYTGLYDTRERICPLIEPCAVDIRELIQKLDEIGKKVIFLGDGVPVYSGQITEMITVPHCFAPPHVNRQRASSVAALGVLYFKEGKIELAKDHLPEYLRKPQAEREREEKQL